MGWPEKIYSITYRTNGTPDKLVAFHANGKIKGEYFYKNGKVQGKVITYFESGSIASVIYYKEGKFVKDINPKNKNSEEDKTVYQKK